jgi:hypothetical protein
MIKIKESVEGKKGKEVEVDSRPNCDICGQPAEYDAKTIYGSWGYLCQSCFDDIGTGLGLGKGQKLIVKGEVR